jgi:hypothetical protein
MSLAEVCETPSLSDEQVVIFDLCQEGLRSGRYASVAEMGEAYSRMVAALGGAPVHEAVATLASSKHPTPQDVGPAIGSRTLVGLLQR